MSLLGLAILIALFAIILNSGTSSPEAPLVQEQAPIEPTPVVKKSWWIIAAVIAIAVIYLATVALVIFSLWG